MDHFRFVGASVAHIRTGVALFFLAVVSATWLFGPEGLPIIGIKGTEVVQDGHELFSLGRNSQDLNVHLMFILSHIFIIVKFLKIPVGDYWPEKWALLNLFLKK